MFLKCKYFHVFVNASLFITKGVFQSYMDGGMNVFVALSTFFANTCFSLYWHQEVS